MNQTRLNSLADMDNLPSSERSLDWCYPREKWIIRGFGRGSIGVIYSFKEYGWRGKGYVADCYCDHKVEVARFKDFDAARSYIYYTTKEHVERGAAQ